MKTANIAGRRTVLKGIAGAIAAPLVFVPGRVDAFEECGNILISDVWKGLEAMFSVPCGPQDREELIYAFVAPWCPFCAQMKEDAMAGRIPARLRMIPTEPRDTFDRRRIVDLVESGGGDGIGRFFNRRELPPPSSLGSDEQNAINHTQLAAQHAMRRVYGKVGVQSGFPMWMTYSRKSAWLNAETMYFSGGWLHDPSQIAENLDIVPHPDPGTTPQWQAMRDAIKTKRPFHGKAFARQNDVKARVLPMDTAMPMFCYQKGNGHGYTHTVTSQGRDWLGLPMGDGAVYVDASQMDIV